jgi:hypothetical protein
VSNINTTRPYIQNTDYLFSDIKLNNPVYNPSNVSLTFILSDSNAGSLTTESIGTATSFYNYLTGIWQAIGKIADINSLLANLKFQPINGYNNNFNISALITDQISPTISGTIMLTRHSGNQRISSEYLCSR